MLAMLYHGDGALLLEHFQTVGVHEGRQGSKCFNVPVYMAHCGKDPLWLDLELTLAQSTELRQVNAYREEVGADPLVLDPENMAFANYRAWYNAVNSVRGHGWLYDTQNKDVDTVFDILGVAHLGENTPTKLGNASESSTFPSPVVYSRDSIVPVGVLDGCSVNLSQVFPGNE